MEGVGDGALGGAVDVEGLGDGAAGCGGGEDSVVPQAVVDGADGFDWLLWRVVPLPPQLAVVADVENGVVVAGDRAAGGDGLLLQGGEDAVGGAGLEPQREGEGGGGEGNCAGRRQDIVAAAAGAEAKDAADGLTTYSGSLHAVDHVIAAVPAQVADPVLVSAMLIAALFGR
jgi:hypothetical protein